MIINMYIFAIEFDYYEENFIIYHFRHYVHVHIHLHWTMYML